MDWWPVQVFQPHLVTPPYPNHTLIWISRKLMDEEKGTEIEQTYSANMPVYLFLHWLTVIFSYADIFGKEINQHAEEGDLCAHGPQHWTSCPRLPGQREQIQYVLRMLNLCVLYLCHQLFPSVEVMFSLTCKYGKFPPFWMSRFFFKPATVAEWKFQMLS